MLLKRSRAAVLAAALITVTLTACAPPGQPGNPGVAATYEGTDVTNQDIDSIYQAWLDGTQGTDVANRRQILTIELLRDDLLAKCKEAGYPVTMTLAEAQANQWIMFKGQQGTATEPMIKSTQGILALYVVVNLDPSLGDLKEISEQVAQSAQVSPRSGESSTEQLLTDVRNAMQSAEDQQLGSQFSYTAYQNVSAFTDEDRSWFDRGGSSSAS